MRRERADDEIFLKLNCEGAECDIAGDLLESTELARIRSVLRVAGAEERAARTRLRQVAYVAAEALHGRRRPLRTALESLVR